MSSVAPALLRDRGPRSVRWLEPLAGLAVVALVLAGSLSPLATAAVLLTVGLVLGLAHWPFLITALLIVFMGNVKINFYLGFFTLFPEYIVLGIAAGLAFSTWLARPAWPPERRMLLAFAAWGFTGLLSLPYAMAPSRVLVRVVLIAMVAVTFIAVVLTVDSRRRLERSLTIWEVVATLYALYGIIQMVGVVAGFDTTLRFMKPYSNPDLFIGIGSPVRRRIGDVFRANSMFNDPNILGGFLAASMTLMLALRERHAEAGRKLRAGVEGAALLIMGACLLLTQSRSGVLGLLVGGGIVLAGKSRGLGRPKLWLGIAAMLVVVVAVAVALGVDPTLLSTRFAGMGDTSDTSNRQHLDVFVYGLQLLARYPLSGVGLGNFGLYYAVEQDAWYEKMMTHCAPLSYFAESGLPGGLAFLGIWWLVMNRLFRARVQDPSLDRVRVGLFASLAAILVANLFYDYITRTFVWVIVGLGIATVRLSERGTRPA